ncbi:hypothetical protein EGW08_011109 [Elysia chlorotica]|uniref:Uncharacterized protein n=1 Tax=Elysia chlorotica TaxID=188477 RepID=A0A433THV0_ELYCH|nr:hypothetical protein EGW08_011109 [Elysia chlorotica]
MDPSPTATPRVMIKSQESDGMEVAKKTLKPKFADLKGSAMTLSGEDDVMTAEASQILMDYAVTKGHTLNSVTHMSRPQLADFLRDFYTKMKQKTDESPPMKDVRLGLHKFFLEEVNIDILQDQNFELANATFDQGMRANPRKCHKVRIEMEDLKKIYLGDAMDTNKPETLQNKVFFDISLYICNKGKDYLRSMKKTDFDVTTDIHGRRYVWLKDASAAPIAREEEYPLKLKLKRAAEDSHPAYQIGERMYERPGDPRCPLASFLKYVTHLHPMMDAFWQRPKRSVSHSDIVWYDHTALGYSTLTKIMQRISQQAGVSDSYTNYSIRSSCIPLVEEACEQAMLAENGGAGGIPAQDSLQPTGGPAPFISHSNSEEVSSDDGLPHPDAVASDGTLSRPVPQPAKPPRLAHSVGSGHSSSLDTDDGDLFGLMQAKTQVLDLIRGLMVKDIQKFVDWLKTVRVQYSAGELIVLCSPVEKSSVEPIPDDILVDRNGVASSRPVSPDRETTLSLGTGSHAGHGGHALKKSGSLDLTDKRMRLRKEASLEHDGFGATTLKQVDFHCVSGVHCSGEELGPLKVSIASADTLLLTSVPSNLQIWLHRKRFAPYLEGAYRDPLPERVFYSDSEMDIAEAVASIQPYGRRSAQHVKVNSVVNGNPGRAHDGLGQRALMSATGNGGYHPHHSLHTGLEPPGQMPVYHKSLVGSATTSVQLQRSVHGPSSYPPVMVIPAAHRSQGAPLCRDQYKDGRGGMMSVSGCLDPQSSHLLTPAERSSLKRGASTGTPTLKRQAHVLDSSAYPENLTMRRAASEDSAHQPTNLSMKSVAGCSPSHTTGSVIRKESPEAKKARAERLADSLRYHQEILQNSPLIKKPGERNFSGFRHCYANTVHNHSVKPEPLDTSYS